MTKHWVTTLVLLSACIPNLQPSKETVIVCDTTADCPTNWSCVNAFCLSPENSEATIPRVAVAFTLPANGDEGVTVSPKVVIAFNFDVEPASLDGRVLLGDIPLIAEATALANTFSFTPAALMPRTSYALRVEPGVTPRERFSRPSEEAFVSTFRTGDAPDQTPPAPVTALVVDRLSPSRAVLTWTRPSDSDFAGVLILRKAGGVVSAVPQAGRTYAIGATVGDAEVIASVQDDRWDDVTVEREDSDYAFFAFDTASNYAAPTRAPLVNTFDLRWCPNETGVVTVTSPDAGVYQLRVSAGATALGVFPDQPTALGTDTPVAPNQVLTLGTPHDVRLVTIGAGGTAVASVRTLWLSKRDLVPVAPQPLPAALGTPVTLLFPRYGWPAFAFEADTQPLAATTTFTALADPLGRFQPNQAGAYRMRVRPVVPGCADAPWTESAEFTVGNARFVGPNGGSGDHSGSSPANAAPTIQSAVLGDTFVAEGEYENNSWSRQGNVFLVATAQTFRLAIHRVTSPGYRRG